MNKESMEAKLLTAVNAGPIADSLTWVSALDQGDGSTLKLNEVHQLFVGVARSLAVREFLVLKESKRNFTMLTKEGELIAAKGSPECQVLAQFVNNETPIEQKTLMGAFAGSKIGSLGFSECFKKKLIRVETVDKKTKLVHRLAETTPDVWKAQCEVVQAGNDLPEAELKAMIKKKFAQAKSTLVYEVTKGPKFALNRKELATDLDVKMLKSGAWANAEFKEYNFNDVGPARRVGCLHPLMKVRAEFKKILLEMGFSEMPTNNFVESSFWNFDALFQPQQHPARDAHDTFFLTEPKSCNTVPEAYCEVVKNTHEKGGFGSIGYRYDWSLEETKKNILRTHTTAVSSRVLQGLGEEFKQTGVFNPVRRFSIDRVFRNETLDPTHLAEFHQVEGFVADYNLTLGDLIGTIKEFFKKIGIEKVRFKPAYNPYTEPSMEIFGFSNELNKWIEVGNSGMFRPEMLQPMGLPADVRVIAWGLSLERPTMIKYGINEIRSLFGPKVRLGMIENNPIARFF